jgi:hypothetical protein
MLGAGEMGGESMLLEVTWKTKFQAPTFGQTAQTAYCRLIELKANNSVNLVMS